MCTPNAGSLHVALLPQAIKGADVIVMPLGLGNDIEGEGRDRAFLGFPQPQAELLAAVQKVRGASKLVVAINSAGGVAMDPTCCDALVQLWYGGQETGHGLADVLWGRVNPSGRLPLRCVRVWSQRRPIALLHARRALEIRMGLPTTEHQFWHCGVHYQDWVQIGLIRPIPY